MAKSNWLLLIGVAAALVSLWALGKAASNADFAYDSLDRYGDCLGDQYCGAYAAGYAEDATAAAERADSYRLLSWVAAPFALGGLVLGVLAWHAEYARDLARRGVQG